MNLSEVYGFLGGFPGSSLIRIRLLGSSELHELGSTGVHRAKLQAMLASHGDAPYKMTGGNEAGYLLASVSEDDTGPILHMRCVPIKSEQIEKPKPEAN